MPNAAVLKVLERLPSAKPTHDGWKAQCPAHKDQSPSLSISEGDGGRALLKCFANCATEVIVEAIGLRMADLMPPKDTSADRRIVAKYPYHDDDGTHLYTSLRFEPKDFRQQLADGRWKLGNVKRVVYRLPKLAGQEAIFIAEGEKDVDALVKIGLAATCNVGGAGKWRDDYSRQLWMMGVRRVCVLPDNDDPGRQHAQDVARSCAAAGLDVRVLELPNLLHKGDVSDWLAAGGTKADLREMAKAAPIWTPSVAAAVTEGHEHQEFNRSKRRHLRSRTSAMCPGFVKR